MEKKKSSPKWCVWGCRVDKWLSRSLVPRTSSCGPRLLREFRMTESDSRVIMGLLQAYPAWRDQMSGGQGQAGSAGEMKRTQAIPGLTSSGPWREEGSRHGSCRTAVPGSWQSGTWRTRTYHPDISTWVCCLRHTAGTTQPHERPTPALHGSLAPADPTMEL